MSSDASSSHPPPLVARAETTLAPGFRFHPTDEELIMYYLKRKILSKPFRVDAISEIDLYKEDPWDLPGKSRIQSRDMEWYFFSPLDRKYSNRSRTNRATATGYWKTTGKDRALKRGERVLGMKKTLVFHVGRAPKGERTNWVMHEYRIDDKELLPIGFSPDEYVVCRIFQKSGSGPQNGVQYGAPFIEEEWENDDNTMMLPDVDISMEEPLLALGAQQLTERDDFEQEIKEVTILKENDGPLALPKRQDNFDNPDVNEETFENESFNAYKQNTGLREVHSRESFGIAEDYAPQVSDENCIPEDGYLELNDFVDSLDVVNASSQDPINELAWIRNDQAFATLGQFATLPELHGVEEFFDFTNENANLQEDTLAPFENKFYFGINDMLDVMGDCPIAEQADDEVVYHDVSDTNQLDKNDDFLEMNDFLHPVLPELCLSDPVDELIAYLNDTEEGMQNSDLRNSERPDPSFSIQVHNDSEVVGDCSDPHVFIASSKKGSSVEIPPARGKCCDDICEADDYLAVKDVKSGKEWEKTITGRLIGMLGSIHSPPAQAAEHPMKGASTSDPSSSMQITAGIVQINGFIMGRRNDWSAQKNDVGFILSYGMVRNDFSSNMEKMHGGAISLMIRNGFCLSLLSVLFLALTFKLVGVCIYGR